MAFQRNAFDTNAFDAPATTVTRVVPQSAALLATVRRTIPQTAALSGFSVRTVPQTGALRSTRTQPVPQTAALRATRARAVAQTASLVARIIRPVPQTAALSGAIRRQIPQTGALATRNNARAIPQTTALRATTIRSVVQSAALTIQALRSVSQTAAVRQTRIRTVPQAAALRHTRNRVVPQTTALRATQRRTVPQNASLTTGALRPVPQTAAISALGRARIVAQRAALAALGRHRAIPQTASLSSVTLALVGHLPGTINIIRNPSFEISLTDWAVVTPTPALFDATWERVTDRAWDGSASVRATVTRSTGAGVSSLVARERVSPNLPNYVAQVRALTSTNDLFPTLMVEFQATDGTVLGSVVSEDDPAHRTTEPWHLHTVNAPVPDGTTRVRTILRVAPRVIGATGQVWFDGVQLEMREQPTEFAIGAFGGSFHRWLGTAHGSPSLRLPVRILTRQIGRGGKATIISRLYRATWDNVWLDDLSADVRSGQVTMDPDRAVKWAGRLTLSGKAYRTLVPGQDFLAPWQRIEYPDGRVREGQLGLYVLRPSPQTWTRLDSMAEIDLADPTWILQSQGFVEPFTVSAGVNLIGAVNSVLGKSGFASRRGQVLGFNETRWNLPRSSKTMPVDTTWESKTPKLKIVNDLLSMANYYHLSADANGLLVSHPYRDLGTAEPERGYYAYLDGAPSEVVGAVKIEPVLPPGNEVVVLMDDPRRTAIKIVERIDAPHVPYSTTYTFATHRVTIRSRVILDVPSAQEVARLYAQRWASLYHRVELSVLPDPAADFLHATLDLGIYDRAREPVAVGRYWVRGASYGFSPRDGLVKLDAARVVDHKAVI